LPVAESEAAVTLPVAAKEVTEVAAPKVPVTVTAPVVALIEIVWKPFSERTGPLNVVFAIIFLRVVALVRTVSTKSAGPVGTNNIPSNVDIAQTKKKGRDFSPPFPPFP
jgi:hypothetical protein